MSRRISVVINTYNASATLSQVLDNLKEFDEIVVCDMESTDNTREIARSYGCKLVTFPKGQHSICEPARNFAIQSASHEWVLVVDADEIVPNELRVFLYSAIQNDNFRDAYAIARKNRFLDKYIGDTPDYQLRFFKKDGVDWPAVIHSKPKVDGRILYIPNKSQLKLIHIDNLSIKQQINKIDRYTDYEVPKRIKKRYTFLNMLIRPCWFFFKSYIFGGAYKYGRRGIAKSQFAAVYQIVLLAKKLEYELVNNSSKEAVMPSQKNDSGKI